MRTKCLACLALLAALSLPPARGGSIASIRYDFHPIISPGSSIGSLIADGRALDAGVITFDDVQSFQFNFFTRNTINGFGAAIDADGVPLDDSTITGRVILGGETFTLDLPWGPDAFGPRHPASWGITNRGHASPSGIGWWGVSLIAAPVPEPSSIALMCVAVACVLASRRYLMR